MIELDDERLDRMRSEPVEAPVPPETTLQPVTFRAQADGEPVEIASHAQRAVWNSEQAARTPFSNVFECFQCVLGCFRRFGHVEARRRRS